MEIDYSLLATLHRMLRQQADLNDRLERGPRQVKVAEANRARFEAEVDAAKQRVVETKMAADEKQLHLGEREAKIKDLEGRLNACDSNKEYQLLKDKIAADEAANGVLSDEILELLERIDELENDQASANDSLTQAVADKEKVVQRVAEQTEKLDAELADITRELKHAEKRLRGEVAIEYRRMVDAIGESALAKTDGKVCGNCQHTFTAQTYNELCMKKPVYCRGCGGLMYMLSSVHSGQEA